MSSLPVFLKDIFMALRDQPYLPLYVQDYLTDEKLRECKPESVGVYSFLMCLMHKSEDYGKILLKQKDKQNTEQVLNFADKIAKHLPYKVPIIVNALKDLLEEKVLHISGDTIYQKRMVEDNNISLKRSEAGKEGVKKKKKFAQAKHPANTQANPEIEIEYENEVESKSKSKSKKEKLNDLYKQYPWLTQGVMGAYMAYKNMRKQIKAPMTFNAEKRALNKLQEICSDTQGVNPVKAIKLLNHAEDKNWKGIYPIEDEKTGAKIGQRMPNDWDEVYFKNLKTPQEVQGYQKHLRGLGFIPVKHPVTKQLNKWVHRDNLTPEQKELVIQ